MQRHFIALLSAALIVGSTAISAFADSPHFNTASATLLNNGNLKVSFKEAGLGSNQNINYEATADATATYACQNGGGNFPSDPKKQTVSGPVSGTGTFSSGKNGSISASLTIAPPASTLNCPGGQREVLGTVSYTNVAITDTTNGVSKTISGTFSKTFVVIP
jgi:hypothetical protein